MNMENLNSDPDDHSQCLSRRMEMLNPHHTSQIDHSEFGQLSPFLDYFYADDEKKDDHDEEIEESYDNDDRIMMTYLSKLSLESFDDTDYADAVERSAEKLKDYENEGARKKKVRSNKKKIVTNEDMETDDAEEDEDEEEEGSNVFGMKSRSNVGCYSGESDCGGGGGGGGLMVITRPKGGIRTLCMDMEEVKACNDLGFELEHERMMEIPSSSRISLSASTLDTSSGGNSPIASWRISSPGDDPRDVKARLKVWAQAVAIVSTSPVLKF